jgi:hypothetical protein
MRDAINTDRFIVPPSVVLEQQLHMIRDDIENITRRLPTSDFYLIREHRSQLREIARLAAEAVQKIDSREWAGK